MNICLDKDFIENQYTIFNYTERFEISELIPQRSKFVHKGSCGHVHLIVGSKGKIGAAALSAKSTLRTGAGLVTIQVPRCGTSILQSNTPEAMILENSGEEYLQRFSELEGANVIGIGPGIGTEEETVYGFFEFLDSLSSDTKLVLDADAINILALKPEYLRRLPQEAILTPHPGEFRRLVGDWSDDFDKLEKLTKLCKINKVNVVLKGAFSAVCNSEGMVHYNPTGNPGMATAGSGDVLLGIVCGLLAQGLEQFDALKTAVYLHGSAGDLAEKHVGVHSLIASDIIFSLSDAIRTTHTN